MCGRAGRTGRERRLGAALLIAAALAGCEASEPRGTTTGAGAPVAATAEVAPSGAAAPEAAGDVPSAAPAPSVAPTAPPTPDAARPSDAVVARIGDQAVTAAELDATMALALADLDQARYELRAKRLRDVLVARVVGPRATADSLSIDAWLAREAAARKTSAEAVVLETFREAGVTVELAPPAPPVVDVSADDDAVRGAADAPVTVIEFIDFQSPYCRRMQPVLRRLLDEFPAQVKLVARDFPLPVHADAAPAAEAAECAGAQDAYWPYHDVLLQEQANLGREALVGYAGRVGLDVPRFTTCLDQRAERAEVEADASYARGLGIGVVPTTFVNGRYLRGPQPYEAVRAAVVAELAARGIALPAVAETSPPAPSASPTTTLAPEAAAPPAATSTTPPSPTTTVPAAPNAVLTLPAQRVKRALADRAALARDLDRPPLDPDPDPAYAGRSLVRVERVPPDGLYALMGLQPGDVIVKVNDAVLLDDGTALFDALRDRASVTVTVLRRGLPETFEYRIE